MIEITVEQFEKNFDKYMDAIEAGEKFLIRKEDGRAVVAVPDGELENIAETIEVDDWRYVMSNHDDAC
jgi:PHD/YefM family antitoxin component YafN of YafNO toxin-antitoxin module